MWFGLAWLPAVCENIPRKACSSGVRTKVKIVRGRYHHTRKTSGPYKQYGNLKSMFFSYSPYSLSMVEGGWLRMLRKRKFRELKTADEKSEKSAAKTRYVAKWYFIIRTVATCKAEQTNKQRAKKQGSTLNGTKSTV